MQHDARYELKYVIEEARAVAIADYVRSYLGSSAFNRSGPIRGYPITSLYLDSPDFHFFRQAFIGQKNRMKLRIRFYDDEWRRPAFLEIKRRVSEVICKDRVMMTREGVRQILAAGWPIEPFWADPTHLLEPELQGVNEDFWLYANRIRAKGAVYISYHREAYEDAHGEELRVTFDREIHGSRYDGSGRLTVPRRGWRPYLPPFMAPWPKDGVVLELKFHNQAPRWMFDLVKLFNLRQTPVCKYAACIYAQQLHWHRQVLPEQEHDLML